MSKDHVFYASITVWIIAFSTWGEQPASASPQCRRDLNTLIDTVEANYVGYHLAIKEVKQTEYDDLKNRLRTTASHTTDLDCIWVLREYVEWFNYGHLFVVENPVISKETSRR